MWRQLPDPALRLSRLAGEDILQVSEGLMPVEAGGLDQAHDGCSSFAGSERAGQRAAAIQSLLATASLNGLESYAWLRSTLEKLPVWPHSRIDELLPLGSRVIDVNATPKDVIDTRIIPR